jgi:hypothetical protein
MNIEFFIGSSEPIFDSDNEDKKLVGLNVIYTGQHTINMSMCSKPIEITLSSPREAPWIVSRDELISLVENSTDLEEAKSFIKNKLDQM